MTLHTARAPTAVARTPADLLARQESPVVSVVPRWHFSSLYFNPRAALRLAKNEMARPRLASRLRRSKPLVFAGSGVPAMAGSASFSKPSAMRESVG